LEIKVDNEALILKDGDRSDLTLIPIYTNTLVTSTKATRV